MPPRAPLSLKGRALRLLGAREHSRLELERKLAQHETEPGQLRRVLDELQSRGYIDERRVVESLLHRRAPRWGGLRIRQDLQGKGLDPQLVSAALEQLASTELQRAREVWTKKFGQLPGDPRERGRQARFLAARGFSGEVIRLVLAGADDG